MPKQLSPKDGKKSSSRRVDTTIVVALIALIGTVATALFSSPVILEWIRNKPTPSASSIQAPLPANTSNPMPVAAVPSRSGSGADCLTQHFAAIAPARQIQIEVGTTNQIYYISSQDLANKDFHGPIGIKLTQNGNMIAALSFLFFTDNRLFKIASLVDSNCQAVAEYSNWDRGGDRNVLQDSETLKIELTEGTFSLEFVFHGPGDLRFNFQQVQ
jgi:hypothetical protein